LIALRSCDGALIRIVRSARRCPCLLRLRGQGARGRVRRIVQTKFSKAATATTASILYPRWGSCATDREVECDRRGARLRKDRRRDVRTTVAPPRAADRAAGGCGSRAAPVARGRRPPHRRCRGVCLFGPVALSLSSCRLRPCPRLPHLLMRFCRMMRSKTSMRRWTSASSSRARPATASRPMISSRTTV
jgi:hypothetical protein